MKTLSCLSIALLLALIHVPLVSAGQLTDELQATVSSSQADQKLTVWISLPADRSAALPHSASANPSRAERYRAVLTHLQTTHAAAQREVVAALGRMENAGLVQSIKPHWLVNVIEAEVAAGALDELSRRQDIDLIAAPPRLTAVVPDRIESGIGMAAGAADHLNVINADDAWAAGYAGAGRLVCTFDTGVDGDHPALAPSWKGNDGNYGAAWFDPRYDGETLPRTIPDCGYQSCNTSHGTHTLGCIVGVDPSTGDTTGVAPEAQWISAAVIDVTGTSIIDAFEWAVNPDGDANSIDDVPDVINHSWGVADVGCQELFFAMVDATEALGIVNIFAAGNEGSAASTIRNPANRALDSIDCFAVGNVDARVGTPVVYGGSSRGPSDCNGAVKPNVTAPGVFIYSTWPGGTYNSMTGTSMAAPQVSGLVALMRQKNPNATVDEIKTAILTTARDFGVYSLPDNDYGWGVIDCMAALNALSDVNTTANVQLYAFDHPPIAAGDTARGTIVLRNIGVDVDDVSASLSGAEPLLTVISGSAYFGTIPSDDTVRSGDQIEVVVSDQALDGSVLSLDLNVTGAGGYAETRKLSFLVEPPLARAIATHDVGLVEFSVSNFGSYGMGDGMFFPAGGEGFSFDGSEDYLYEGGLIIGADSAHVSDGLRNAVGEPDGDFGVLPDGNLVVGSGPYSSQQITARFGDARAENPLGLEITQHSFAYPSYPNDDFIILRYILTNTQAQPLSGVYVGLYLDWDVVNWSSNAGGFNVFDEFVWTAYNSGGLSQPRGALILEGALATGLTAQGALVSYNDDGFTEVEKMWALTNGTVSADYFTNSTEDLVQLIASGPYNWSAGQTDTVAFAILAAATMSGITDASDRAREAYTGLVTDVDDDPSGALPDGFSLHQNYPNPFNPATTISFDLPRKSDYRLSIYNIAGQKVAVFEGAGTVGVNRVVWNAEGIASGVYLYKLTAGDYTASRKMLLLR